jgi:L-cysteine desulfidase
MDDLIDLTDSDVLKFLKTNVKPAAGCTEVVAIGLATSIAYNSIYGNYPKTTGLPVNESIPIPRKERLEKIEVVMDRNVFKNAFGVAIPNTGKKGIKLAAALGLFLDVNKYSKSKEDPGYLEIFKQLDRSLIPVAETMVDKVSVSVDYGKRELYIHVKLFYDGQVAESALRKKHDGIYFIRLNGETIYEGEEEEKDVKKPEKSYKLKEILEVVERIGEREKSELQRTIDVNKLLVEEGLLGGYGMGVVRTIKNLMEKGLLPNDLHTKIKLQVAAGVEARMGGSEYPAMSSSGSGNNGITATVPIIVTGEHLNVEKERILKGILVSHMIVKASTDHIGELSALCGVCNKSAFGAAAGLTYMLGGREKEIENAIRYVASNIIGTICDGAKYGCVLKSMTAASVAYEAALFSLSGIEIPADGVVEKTADDTLKNLGEVAEAMSGVDDVVVKLIQQSESG